jgi:hypothetical protein
MRDSRASQSLDWGDVLDAGREAEAEFISMKALDRGSRRKKTIFL